MWRSRRYSYEDKEPCGRIQLSEKEAGERKTNFDAFECGMTKQEACQEAQMLTLR